MVVRDAVDGDLDASAQTIAAETGGSAHQWRQRFAEVLADPDRIFLVAVAHGRVIGFGQARRVEHPEPVAPDAPPAGWLPPTWHHSSADTRAVGAAAGERGQRRPLRRRAREHRHARTAPGRGLRRRRRGPPARTCAAAAAPAPGPGTHRMTNPQPPGPRSPVGRTGGCARRCCPAPHRWRGGRPRRGAAGDSLSSSRAPIGTRSPPWRARSTGGSGRPD